MEASSLYERLGGVYVISAVVDHFSDQLVEKGTIEEQTRRSRTGTRRRPDLGCPGLRFLRTLWVCAIAGGPFEYTGLPLDDAHAEFRLSPEPGRWGTTFTLLQCWGRR